MSTPDNYFLAALNAADRALLTPPLREAELIQNEVLFDEGGVIHRVFFPTSGAVSFVVAMADGDQIEAGMVGRDGVVGGAAVLDGPCALNRAIVQLGGTALVISTEAMKTVAAESETLRRQLFKFDQLLLGQAQQSAACNALHSIEERLCRWLLRTRDLSANGRIGLTQEALGQMLGVRRTSVTLAARHLQSSGLIRYRRGDIQVVDLEGLRDSACECYEVVKAQVQRVFPTLLATPALSAVG